MFSIKALTLSLLLATSFVGCFAAKGGSNAGDGSSLRSLAGKSGKSGYGKGGYGKGSKGFKCSSKFHSELQTKYFDIRLAKGQNQTILKDGTLHVYSTCDSWGASIYLRAVWDKDLLVFGDTSDDSNFFTNLPANVTLIKKLWNQGADGQGNDVNDGAVWMSTGHYVGWGGDFTIGIHRSTASELDLAGGAVNCILAGIFNYVFPQSC